MSRVDQMTLSALDSLNQVKWLCVSLALVLFVWDLCITDYALRLPSVVETNPIVSVIAPAVSQHAAISLVAVSYVGLIALLAWLGSTYSSVPLVVLSLIELHAVCNNICVLAGLV